MDYPNFTDEEKVDTVFNKLKKSKIFNNTDFTDQDFLDAARHLATPEGLKRGYLTKDWLVALNMHKELTEPPKTLRSGTFSSQPLLGGENTVLSSNKFNIESVVIQDDEEDVSEEDLEIAKKEQEEIFKQPIKVKLVVTEIANTSTSKLKKKIFSPILNSLNIGPKLGQFHTGLLIGPWIIEWTNGEFIKPRRTTSKNSIITADLEVIATKQDLDKTIDIVAQCVSDYNVFHTYSILSNKKYHSNCQDFVEDLLQRLDIKIPTEGALGKYLEEMKTKGEGRLKFTPSKEFAQKFSMKEKFIIFSNHIELDELVRDFLKIDPKFKDYFPSEYTLLKSFDRALWLRHFHFPNHVQFMYFTRDPEEFDEITGLDDGKDCGCPFLDPRTTNSITFMKN